MGFRPSDPAVTDLGALQDSDCIPIDRAGVDAAKKTSPLRIREYLAATPITHAELLALQGSFVPEQEYKITDFTSSHFVYGTIDTNTCPVEPIIVRAATASTLYTTARSETYPQDILEYELVCNSFWGTFAVGGRTGWITYREDRSQNLKFTYDMRHVKWRRWNTQVDGLGVYTGLAEIFTGGVPHPYQDFLTYGEYALHTDNDYGNRRGKYGGLAESAQSYNNIWVVGASANNRCDGWMVSNTFLGDFCHSNNFGQHFNRNIFAGRCNYNTFMDAFASSVFSNSYENNWHKGTDFNNLTDADGNEYTVYHGQQGNGGYKAAFVPAPAADGSQEGYIPVVTAGANVGGYNLAPLPAVFLTLPPYAGKWIFNFSGGVLTWEELEIV